MAIVASVRISVLFWIGVGSMARASKNARAVWSEENRWHDSPRSVEEMTIIIVGIAKVLLPHGMIPSIVIRRDQGQGSLHQVSLNDQVPVCELGRTAVAGAPERAQHIWDIDPLIIECSYESTWLARLDVGTIFTKLDCAVDKHWCRIGQGAVFKNVMAMMIDGVNGIKPPRPHCGWDDFPQMFARINLVVVYRALKSSDV